MHSPILHCYGSCHCHHTAAIVSGMQAFDFDFVVIVFVLSFCLFLVVVVVIVVVIGCDWL